MVTAHDLRNLVEANINDICRDYNPTNESLDAAHGNIYRDIRRKAANIATQFIHMYGERELPDAAINDLANEVASALEDIVSRPHDYAAHTECRAVAERKLADNYDEISETYKEHGGSDAASDPMLAVDVWNKACAEKVAQYWETEIDWLCDSLTDI